MDVLFVVPPFADVGRPALGASLLKAEITRRGFSSRIRYFNLDLAELIGLELYLRLANAFAPDSLVGEWFFADLVFGDQLPEEQEYVSKVLWRYSVTAQLVSDILKARRLAGEFVDRCVQEIESQAPQVVGFTTTFHQTCASLAMAKRLKQSPAPPVVTFGGANCEGEMGLQLIRAFPQIIDYVCTQEGDVAFPWFLHRLLREGNAHPIPGILRREESLELTSPQLVRDLDNLPIPDYFDYFEQLQASPLSTQIRPDLLIETSRGCWWGEKNHCTFCGLNGQTMQFRGKSAERVFQELSYLSKTYGLNRIECVDNILDMKYLKTLFPKLIESDLQLELFYETKANLKWYQLSTLQAGGVRSIQPGIESLSNEVLRLMRKGCTSVQNLQLLRWCEELGISVAWNILFGFPGESASEYEHMAHLIPLLTHLQPPASCTPFRLDRFSPNFTYAEQFGLTRVRPMHSYYYVFPLGRQDLEKLAYFFEFDYGDRRDPIAYTRALIREVQRWWACHAVPDEDRPRLDLLQTEDAVLVTDSRGCAVMPRYRLEGREAEVYMLCDVAQTFTSLVRELGCHRNERQIREALDTLLNAKLMIEVEGYYLSLAVMRNRAPQGENGASHVNFQHEETTAT